MTSEATIRRVCNLANAEGAGWSPESLMASATGRALVKYVDEVSEIGKELLDLQKYLSPFSTRLHELTQSLILPEPEDALLKQAREICARDADERGNGIASTAYRSGGLDRELGVRIALAALKECQK